MATSPLADGVWDNRIAVPLDFNPVDSPCPLGGAQRRIGGSEMLLPAITNWQPALCADPGDTPFVFGITGDTVARQQLVTGSAGAPDMVAVSRPVDPAVVDPQSPVVYAPLTTSGVAIAFNFERNPKLDAPAEETALKGTGVRDINLTPRLVAKLLSQSYRLPDVDLLDPDALRVGERQPVGHGQRSGLPPLQPGVRDAGLGERPQLRRPVRCRR